MTNKLFFAFFEFFPLINPGISLEAPYEFRSNFTPTVYEQFIEEKVETLALTGAELIILSTVEENGFTFYESDRVLNNEFDNLLSPTPYYPRKFSPQGFYLDGIGTLLNKADELGIKVVIGTGRNGDKGLMVDIFRNCRENPLDPNGPCQDQQFKDRFIENFRLTKLRMKDLDYKYGQHPAMAGFYLTHETSRFRATMNRYYIPAAKYAKELDSDYLVVTSPSYIYKDERPKHGDRLDELAASGIDALLYQDRMGEGTIQNGNSVKFTYDSNLAIDNYLFNYLNEIHQLHNQSQGASPEMWINMESWRIECLEWNNDNPDVCDETSKSHPAHRSTFQKQIDIAKNFGPIGTYEVSAIFQKPGGQFLFQNNQRSQNYYRVRAIRLTQCFTFQYCP